MKYEEVAVEVVPEETRVSVKVPELFDRLDPEERKAFDQLEPAGIENGKWTPLTVENSSGKGGFWGFFGNIGNFFGNFVGMMSAFDDGAEECLNGGAEPARFDNDDF